MKPTYVFPLFALLLFSGLLGCASDSATSATQAGEEDEYEGRLFSWKSAAEPDQKKSAEQLPTTQQAKPAPLGKSTHPTKSSRDFTYSTEDDEDGDRGFIIHSTDNND